MATFILGKTLTELPCIYGLGKSFRSEEPCDPLPAGTEILSRFDADGWHKFTVKEYGHTSTYAVKKAAILDAALGLPGAPAPRELALAEIRRLMKTHGITVSELQ